MLHEQLVSLCELIARGQHKEARMALAAEADSGLFSAFDKMLAALEKREFQFSEAIVELAALRLAQEEEKKLLLLENQTMRQNQPKINSRIDLVTQDKVMQNLLQQVERVANISVNVLITGETGTGKGLLAKRMHYLGKRGRGPLVDINCAASPESLLESELFGIEKGVASGVNARQGLFEQANGGTLFLDEIGDMPLNCQAKILKAMENSRITRVGGRVEIPVDARLIAATHKDLEKACQKGYFRQDLYFRLNVVTLHIPALRERSEDIVLMAQHFLRAACLRFNVAPKRFTPKALQALQSYLWPGNVRELEHEVERAVLLTPDVLIDSADFSPKLRSSVSLEPPGAGSEKFPQSRGLTELDQLLRRLYTHKDLRDKIFQRITVLTAKAIRTLDFKRQDGKMPDLRRNSLLSEAAAHTAGRKNTILNQAEKILIARTLEECGNNKTRAAEMLGITREGLRKKMKRLGLQIFSKPDPQ
jgi:DNA-binding NtrC family response regulator